MGQEYPVGALAAVRCDLSTGVMNDDLLSHAHFGV